MVGLPLMTMLPILTPPRRVVLTVVLVILALILCATTTEAQVLTQSNPSATTESSTVTNGLTFGLERIPALQVRPLANIPLWQYVASLLYVFLAFGLSRLADYVIGVHARRWAARTENTTDDLVIALLRKPAKLIIFVLLLHIGIRVYTWPEVIEDIVSKSLKLVVAVSLTYVAVTAVEIFMQVWHRRIAAGNDLAGRELLPLIRKTLKVFVIIVAALVTFDNLGVNVTGIIASLSIGGLAVGLAAQDTLANLFGAVAVLMDKPFRVGDRIQLGSVDGFVETIGFRCTRVRNLDGHLVSIPNKEVGNATIVNIALRPNIRTVMTLNLPYDTPPEQVERATNILRSVYTQHPLTHDVWISFNQFGVAALNIQIIHWWGNTDYKHYLAGMQELNLEIKRQFTAAGIEFALPAQTIRVQDQRIRGETPGVQSPTATVPPVVSTTNWRPAPDDSPVSAGT